MTPDYASLGASIRTAREARGMSCADVGARICELYPDSGYDPETLRGFVDSAERGWVATEAGDLPEIAAALGVSSQEADRWHALAGLVSPDLLEALCANPGAWDAIRKTLAGGV